MQHIVLIIHIILAVALVIVVLLQRSEGAGLAGPSASGMMPVRGAANLLTRTTAVLAGAFMLTSLTLAVLASHQKPHASLADSIAAEQQQLEQGINAPPPVSDAPPAPATPSPAVAPPPAEPASAKSSDAPPPPAPPSGEKAPSKPSR